MMPRALLLAYAAYLAAGSSAAVPLDAVLVRPAQPLARRVQHDAFWALPWVRA